MVRDDKGPLMLDTERNGSCTLNSGGTGEADDDIVVAQFGDGGDITINIGDVASNLDELGEDSANPPCILTSGHDVKVDLEKPIEVSLDE
ncbi:hypothetical protein GN958_ATG01199 [Phytophthora infestans]|uniref:Uncharacterized protein n=1 Tax=Phytophthora infestans TaxID=4787 RepID=A0A8S9V995_PHYIN|nr:hypothetical protein GN958_ATG01199 [Phytophthora infestans]